MTDSDEPISQFVQCRIGVLGHSWRHLRPQYVDGLIVLVSKCSHCGTQRTKKLTAEGGQVQNPKYIYPDGYKGRKRTANAWRDKFVRHLVSLGGTDD